jgi:hypothetical protein
MSHGRFSHLIALDRGANQHVSSDAFATFADTYLHTLLESDYHGTLFQDQEQHDRRLVRG